VTPRLLDLFCGAGGAAINRRKTHCPKGHPLVMSLARQRRECPVCRKNHLDSLEAKRKLEKLVGGEDDRTDMAHRGLCLRPDYL